MRTGIKTAAIAAGLMLSALAASAEVNGAIVADPLMKQILSRQLTAAAGGVTGAVRLGSGQTIELSVGDPLAPLKPVEGLVEKPIAPAAEAAPAKTKGARRTARRADEQLRKMSDDKRAADWVGRK